MRAREFSTTRVNTQKHLKITPITERAKTFLPTKATAINPYWTQQKRLSGLNVCRHCDLQQNTQSQNITIWAKLASWPIVFCILKIQKPPNITSNHSQAAKSGNRSTHIKERSPSANSKLTPVKPPSKPSHTLSRHKEIAASYLHA